MRRILVVAFTIVVLVTLAAPAAGRDIARRKVRQDTRISHGVASGTLSPTEAARLDHQEQAVDREEHAMREANDGRLTFAERRVLTHQQNRMSRRIFAQSHDGNDR